MLYCTTIERKDNVTRTLLTFIENFTDTLHYKLRLMYTCNADRKMAVTYDLEKM
jgi:hypothetical protein